MKRCPRLSRQAALIEAARGAGYGNDEEVSEAF